MNLAKLFVVSAPSGAGKTTLVQELLDNLPQGCCLKRVITYTTRRPRPNETEAQYHFMTKAAFEDAIKQDFFLEWSTWYGDYYGSPQSVLDDLRKGISLILILDRAGARAVKAAFPQAELIWIQPPSLTVLEERLKRRGDDEQTRTFRLNRAALELEEEKKEHLFNYVVVNDSLSQALQDLKQIVCAQKSC